MTNAKRKLSFKKHPHPTGLASIGARTHIDIKCNGKVCGSISETGLYSNDEYRWQVWFSIVKDNPKLDDGNSNCDWRNIRLKAEVNTEAEAREWVKTRWKSICDKFTLHCSED